MVSRRWTEPGAAAAAMLTKNITFQQKSSNYVDQSWEYINRSQTLNVEIGTEAEQFLFWENINGIFVAM